MYVLNHIYKILDTIIFHCYLKKKKIKLVLKLTLIAYNSPSLNRENTCSPISVDLELPSWEYEALGFASGCHIPTRVKSSHFTEMDEMYYSIVTKA